MTATRWLTQTLALLALLIAAPVAWAQQPAAPEQVSTIAFGSCARQTLPQPIWDTIAQREPDLFIFLGDTAYADSTDPDAIAATFETLGRIEPFARFREQCPILAVWDDHDFGLNDMGAEHPNKAQAQQVFLRFFEEPDDSPRWQREGLYGSWTYGPPGRRVQVILLDTRYHRSALNMARLANWRAYLPQKNPDATMLGDTQWAWLDKALREPADIRLLVSSIQILPSEHRFEKWSNIPAERQRLLDLLAQPHVNGVVLISGDRHHGEISVKPRDGMYPLIEITASGMTHAGGSRDEKNQWREGEMTFDHHFGQIEIDWSADDPTVTLELVNIDDNVVLHKAIKLSMLQPKQGG